MEILLKLSLDEVNALLSLLGQMQNSTNTYPLLLKIREQGVEQVKSVSANNVVTAE